MTIYTTKIIDELRGCERALEAFEKDDEKVVIDIRAKEGYIATMCPFIMEKDTPLAKGLISLLKTEAWRLKRELQQNLDIADVIHYEE
jgi:hypothetical protein